MAIVELCISLRIVELGECKQGICLPFSRKSLIGYCCHPTWLMDDVDTQVCACDKSRNEVMYCFEIRNVGT